MSTRPFSPESGWLDTDPEGSAEARLTPHPLSNPAIATIGISHPTMERRARTAPIITPTTHERNVRHAVDAATGCHNDCCA